ncbi:MAG TPA: TonB-dependent receptor [Prolixibacteraceae bacterium]|nr:TonB-dependent receptor [Prolixibacteraceae bacterium]
MKITSFTKRISFILIMSMLSMVSLAQEKLISGNVSDVLGRPLTGVTIVIPGTTTGTVTDIEGHFTLKAPANSELQFSFIGYVQQTIVIGNQTSIEITLVERALDLDEVVVVGYGTIKKADLTGSVGSISAENLVGKGTATMMESLQGEIPGVSITQNSSRAGGGFDIQIRGVQSIKDKKDRSGPLFVVDGIVVSDIQMLNPADIERVDVLKDASSTAIYGSRASNGVVMVTTKSARGQGEKTKKPTISYDGYVGLRQVARMPSFMNGSEFMQYRFSRYTTRKGRASANGSVNYQITPENLQISLLTNYLPEQDENDKYLVGPGYWNEYYPDGTGMSKVEQMMSKGEYYDWMDLVTQNAIQQNHFVSVSGASNNSSYHFGAGYQQDEGIFLKDNEKRFNIKAAIDTKVGDNWNAGVSLNLAHTLDDWGSNKAVANAFWSNPYFIPWDEDGNYYLQSGVTNVLGTNTGAQFSSLINPLIDMDNTIYGAKKLHILGNVYLAFSPIKNLTFKTTLSPNIYQGRTHLYEGVNTESRNSAQTDRAEVETTNMFDWTWDNQVNYILTKGNHSINAMGLFSMNQYTKEYFYQYGEDFPSNTTYYNMGNAGTTIAPKSGYTEHSLISFAARLNYSYKGKYIVTGTMRSDGSSRFYEGNRWGTFPSAAIAWRASEEDFLKADWLTNLKLRLSYGVTGNNNVGDYATATMPSSSSYYAFGSTMGYGYGPNGIVNAAIQWEKTTEFDFGVDFSALKGRINVIADVYNKISDGLLMKRSLAIEAGGGATVNDNIGKISNKGFELSINTVNVNTKNLRWETTFSFGTNKNAIEELYGGTVEKDLGNLWFVGQPVDIFYNYTMDGIVNDKPITVTLPNSTETKTYEHAYEFYKEYYGIYEGMPIIKDLNNDGAIDDKDKSIVGKAEPDWTGSFSTSLIYKKWDFSATVYAKQSYMVESPFLRQYGAYNDRGRMHVNMDYYIPANTPILLSDGTVSIQEETHYGAYPYPNDQIENGGSGTYYGTTGNSGIHYFTDASFVKVKNISLGYTAPSKFLSNIGISYLRLYVNVLNPFTFTNYEGFDPEWAGSKLNDGGPSTVTYQFGVNLKF